MSTPRVPKNTLLLIAGIVWILAGSMVMLVGIPLEIRLAPEHLVLLPLAAAVFVAFYVAVFGRLVRKHTLRIRAREEDRLPVHLFFNRSSWIVMAVMMGGGMALRVSHVFPDWAIACFYTGLGIALFLSGVRFVAVYASGSRVAAEP